jgi:hypothetical protein
MYFVSLLETLVSLEKRIKFVQPATFRVLSDVSV